MRNKREYTQKYTTQWLSALSFKSSPDLFNKYFLKISSMTSNAYRYYRDRVNTTCFLTSWSSQKKKQTLFKNFANNYDSDKCYKGFLI